jgi:deazaflavin-dependent oxidoreductase (nitroreductase family)
MAPAPTELTRSQRGALALARTRLFRKVIGPKVLGRLDRWVLLKTKGRYTAFGPPQFPTMVLITTGRRSGERRPVSLVYAPVDGVAYVVGSNWARDGHPAWSHNLIADPTASVVADGEEWAATADLLTEEEAAVAWPRLIEVMPQWEQYITMTERTLRVFRLNRVG